MSSNDGFATIKMALDYNGETGIIKWNKLDMVFFLNAKSCSGYNIRAGNEAGYLAENGYMYIRFQDKLYRAHRLAWYLTYGEWPNGQIDHINGIRNDNRIENLRVVDDAENRKNMCLRTDNKSGVSGVHWYKAYEKWMVYINSNGKRKNLGYFSDLFEAVCARKSAERDMGFHLNHGREHHGYN